MDLLPVGSVVLLKNANKRLLVFGILQMNPEDSQLYDYIAVPYPEGRIDASTTVLFNHVDIENVFALGFIHADHQLMAVKTREAISKLKAEFQGNIF